jgi:pimeloyl-ACP methyl ester carboxylesterase
VITATEYRLQAGVPLTVCRWTGPGAEQRPPTVVLHGFLEQGAAWERVARNLGGDVHAPDHRGHGRSAHVGHGGFYHFWDYVGDVQALVDHLGGPVDLVGHSMGGTMSVLFTGARPEAVRRLVLVEGLGPPDLEDKALQVARQFLDSRRQAPRHPVMADLAAAAKRMQRYNRGLSDAEARRLAARITRPVDGGVTWSWDPLHRSRSPVPFQHKLFLRFLAQIQCPVLLVDGADSPFAAATDARRRDALQHAEHATIAGAGHLLHHDQPEALARVIRAFLEG